MSYQTTFTVTPKEGEFLKPFDIVGKIADGQECCVYQGALTTPVIATHKGGYFYVEGAEKPLHKVTEATPIPDEGQWPAGCKWTEADWEELGIYPPRPVQSAVLIVTMNDGRTFEVTAPFTDETPEKEEDQVEHQRDMDIFAALIKKAYRLASPLLKDYQQAPTTRWAWQSNEK